MPLTESKGVTGAAYAHGRTDAHGKSTADTHLGEFKGPHQESTEPWTLTEDDLRFPLLKDGDYIDSLSMLGVTPRGEAMLCQLLVTNLGMSPRVAIQFKWTNGDGVVKFLKDEHAVSKLTVCEGGLGWEVNGQHRFSWDPETRTGHARISLPKEKFEADLAFKCAGRGYKIGDGVVSFGAKKFQFLAYPAPRAIVSGSAALDGKPFDLEGATGFVSHAFQNMRAHHIACRWHMVKFHAHEDKLTCNINVGIAPASCHHAPMANGAVYREGDGEELDIMSSGTGAHVELDNLVVDKNSGYPVPGRVRYTYDGLDERGRRVRVVLRADETHVVERLDILSTLPWVLKQVIKAFIAQPYFYVFIDRCEAEVTVDGGETRKVTGVMLHEVMYLSKGGMEATAWRKDGEGASGEAAKKNAGGEGSDKGKEVEGNGKEKVEGDKKEETAAPDAPQ